MPKNDILVARQAFHCRIDGRRVAVPQGATVRADHPLAKALPRNFEPLTVTFDTVEQATAEPGGLRNVTPAPEPEPELEKKGRPGRPKLPRDADGNIIREGGDG